MNENQDINVNTEVQGEQETPINNTQEVQEKMLPQSKVNEVVEGRLKREREKLNKEWQEKFDALQESIKLQTMSEDEKQQFEYDKRIKDLEARENDLKAREEAYNKAQYKATIEKQLSERNLPLTLSDMMLNMNAEDALNKMNQLQADMDTQVNAQIENRIKASASTPVVAEHEAKPLTLDDVANMTPSEIKAHKSEVEKVLMEAFKK